MPKTNTDIRNVRKYIAENINFEKQNQQKKPKQKYIKTKTKTKQNTIKMENKQVTEMAMEIEIQNEDEIKANEKNEIKMEKKDETKAEKKEEFICEHHADANLLEDQHEGTVVCSACGVVVVEQIICGISEWRTFSDDTQADSWQRSRVGGQANRFLSSGTNLSTTIRPAENRSRNGDSFNSSVLRTISRKSVDNGIYHGLKQLDEMAERIHLAQSVLDYAHYLYYKMYKKGQFKGIALHTDAKVGACLYIACYHAQCPRTVYEICGVSENGHQSIQRAIQRITKMLNLPVGPIECHDILPRYCAWLSLPHQIERESISIAVTLTQMLANQRDFRIEIISAIAIYLATKKSKNSTNKRTQKDIADHLGVTKDEFMECYRYFQQC